jgi:hypothetical protein
MPAVLGGDRRRPHRRHPLPQLDPRCEQSATRCHRSRLVRPRAHVTQFSGQDEGPVGPVPGGGGGDVGSGVGEGGGSSVGEGSGDGGGVGSGDCDGDGSGGGEGWGDGDGSGEGDGEGEGDGAGEGEGAGDGEGRGPGPGPGGGGGGPNVGPGPTPGVKRSPLRIGTMEGGTPAAATTGTAGAPSVPPRACGSSPMNGTPPGVVPPSNASPRASDTRLSWLVPRKSVSTRPPTIALSPNSAAT